MAIAEFDNQPGSGGLLERMYGVTNREAQPMKRKLESITDDDEDEGRKKSKAKFTGASGGGMLGDYMKSEHEKGAAENGPSTAQIDLTNEDDDDLIFVGETLSAQNKEVCLGRLFAQANVFRIPAVPKNQMGSLGKDVWPQTRVTFRRSNSHNNNIIDLFDRPSGGGNMGTKFGTMDIRVAATLCPLLDGNNVNKMRIKIYVEPSQKKPGEFPGGRVSRYLPLSIVLYSPQKFSRMIGSRLSQKGLFLSAPNVVDRGIEIDNPHIPKNFNPIGGAARKPQSSQVTYVTRTQEEMMRETSTMFDSLVKSEDLLEMEPDPKIVLTPLMSHQKQALHFLTQHERGEDISPEDGKGFSLWKSRMKKDREVWYNIITNHEVTQKPDPVRGGILADMMGLGKTLSVLALISSTLIDARKFGDHETPVDMETVERNSNATLIICPKSVMSNWEEQVKLHTKADRFKVYSYHGPGRTQDLDFLAGQNIVLTSYNTAAAEFSDKTYKRNALASIQWFRIVLDEAHQIRTQSTQVSKACCSLYAQRRWAVTGTPVQNRLDDLGALIKFLRVKPFDDSTSWSQHIIAPFKNANENVIQHLRLLVDSITLRRLKDKIGFTKRSEIRERLNFSEDEHVTYSRFAQEASKELRIMMGGNNRLQGKSYAHVLKSLSRLRALCAHGREMLNEVDLQVLEGLKEATAIDLGDEPSPEPDGSFISEKHAYDTLQLMSETEQDICTNCSRKVGDKKVDANAVIEIEDDSDNEDDSPESSEAEVDGDTLGYITPCYHLLCPRCCNSYTDAAIPELTQDHYHKCPYDDQYVRFGVFELRRSALKSMLEAKAAAAQKDNRAKWDESTYSGPHTKVIALLEDLKRSAAESAQLPPGEAPIRSVVFSGWTTYLDLIEHALNSNNIPSVRLDGRMTLKQRSAVLRTFKSDPSIAVLLVSIKAGGQGLNFTAANKVYMMEPQFNPGVEQQAIDRVHRLGQTRDVEIKHYIMRDSVEEKILLLQEKKEKLARLSLERKVGRSEEARRKIEELRDLFK